MPNIVGLDFSPVQGSINIIPNDKHIQIHNEFVQFPNPSL